MSKQLSVEEVNYREAVLEFYGYLKHLHPDCDPDELWEEAQLAYADHPESELKSPIHIGWAKSQSIYTLECPDCGLMCHILIDYAIERHDFHQPMTCPTCQSENVKTRLNQDWIVAAWRNMDSPFRQKAQDTPEEELDPIEELVWGESSETLKSIKQRVCPIIKKVVRVDKDGAHYLGRIDK